MDNGLTLYFVLCIDGRSQSPGYQNSLILKVMQCCAACELVLEMDSGGVRRYLVLGYHDIYTHSYG